MSTAKSAIVESMDKRHLRVLPSRKQPQQPTQRLEKIRDIASALLEEASALQHDGNLAAATTTVNSLNEQSEIDFFDEVRRFEIRLIERAMEVAGGNQARAARILGLGTTTLNYKIKTYQLG